MKELDIGGLLVREDGMVKSLSSHHAAIKDWHTGSNSNGYRIVKVPGFKSQQRVHRLVAEAFIPNPNNKEQVNHINGVKNDNRVENLEWCTCQENIRHAWDTGLAVVKTGIDHHSFGTGGKDHQCTKLTVEDCNDIKNHLSEGKLSQTKIAKLYGVTQMSISRINKGTHWSCNK